MRQVLHGCARTTEAVRRAIQHSQSLNALAVQYGINLKTVEKWLQRQRVRDSPMGPKQVLSPCRHEGDPATCRGYRQGAVSLAPQTAEAG